MFILVQNTLEISMNFLKISYVSLLALRPLVSSALVSRKYHTQIDKEPAPPSPAIQCLCSTHS